MTTKPNTHYENLKICRDAPEVVVQAAYKALMQLYHPGNFKGREEEALELVRLIKDSYDVLINPITRSEYDRWLDKETNRANQGSQQNINANTIRPDTSNPELLIGRNLWGVPPVKFLNL